MAIKDRYEDDKDLGIRSVRDIKKLPVSELSDVEIVKLFFHRFKATAMVMMYQDKDDKKYCFGRSYMNLKQERFVKGLVRQFEEEFGIAENWQ